MTVCCKCSCFGLLFTQKHHTRFSFNLNTSFVPNEDGRITVSEELTENDVAAASINVCDSAALTWSGQ